MSFTFMSMEAEPSTPPATTYETGFNATFLGTRCQDIYEYDDTGRTICITRECCKFRFWINFGGCEYSNVYPFGN